MSSSASPAVTVIALCYNHERFLIECLESIRTQTFQDFELIVTDDGSRDSSPQLIEAWLAQHRPDAQFIWHKKNAGICATLNEALTCARGEFISMIATDDAWEPDKIERQLEVMRSQSEDVAVVYSDANQMDEAGVLLSKKFIEAHRPESEPPSGRLFSTLLDRNFIPAMATLIRRRALEAVSGYDERLTYEDYDMWLRLAQRYEFVFCPGAVARYRIVSTSLVRSHIHEYSQFLIIEKCLSSHVLSSGERNLCAVRLWDAAYLLYLHDNARAPECLWTAFILTRKPRPLLLAIACFLGISRSRAKKLASLFKGSPKG